MNIENLSGAETVWIVVNVVTLVVMIGLLREAWMDWRVVQRSGRNGLYRRVTIGSVRRFALKVFMAVAFTAAGFYSGLFIPKAAHHDASIFIAGLLIAADVALMLLGFENAAERGYAMDYLDRQETMKERQDAGAA